MDSQIINIVISLGILVFLGVIAFAMSSTASKQRRQRKSPRLGAEVHVVTKREEKHGNKREYFVKFRLKNDEIMELAVPEEVFRDLDENDYIKIIFKGDIFEDYKRLNETTEKDLDTDE